MQGGYAVATSGDRVVIRDCSTNGLNGAAWNRWNIHQDSST